MYKDGSIFYKTLQKGTGTASPYADCVISMKVSIQHDGKDIFRHPNPFDKEVVEDESATWDLERYEVPAAIRKIIKKTKRNEFVEIRVKKPEYPELLDHLTDP